MFECARILKTLFGADNVYHLMGDEFIILMEGKTYSDMKRSFSEFDKELEKYNAENKDSPKLFVSKGFVAFDAKKHSDYRHVFIDSKAKCDEEKAKTKRVK